LVGGLGGVLGAGGRTVGYTPARWIGEARLDPRYMEQRRTDGEDFTPVEVLRYWSDLMRDGLVGPHGPAGARLIVLGGGLRAACEAQMALALGVPVGRIESESVHLAQALDRPPWKDDRHLIRLPRDPEALRRFVGGVEG
jgi:hypothetical protein